MVSRLLQRPLQLQEENGHVRIDQEAQKKNLQRPPLPHKGNVPASVGMDGLAEVQGTQLLRPFSGPPWPEAHLFGLTGNSASRLKPPEDDLPRPYKDPKSPAFKTLQKQELNSCGEGD